MSGESAVFLMNAISQVLKHPPLRYYSEIAEQRKTLSYWQVRLNLICKYRSSYFASLFNSRRHHDLEILSLRDGISCYRWASSSWGIPYRHIRRSGRRESQRDVPGDFPLIAFVSYPLGMGSGNETTQLLTRTGTQNLI